MNVIKYLINSITGQQRNFKQKATLQKRTLLLTHDCSIYGRFITMYLVFECRNAHAPKVSEWVWEAEKGREKQGKIYMTEMTMMSIKITHNFFSLFFWFSRLFELSHIRARTQFGWRGKSHFARLPKRMNVKEWQIFWNILHIQWFCHCV